MKEIEFLVQNSGHDPSYGRFKQEYLKLLISKSSDLKAQIYLRVQDYNFDEGVKVR